MEEVGREKKQIHLWGSGNQSLWPDNPFLRASPQTLFERERKKKTKRAGRPRFWPYPILTFIFGGNSEGLLLIGHYNPVSYCLLNRGHWERHPICQGRPAQSLAAGCVLFLSCLLLCSFPSKPHPHPHSYPSPSCPRFSPLLLAFSTLPTFVSTSARGGVCQGRTELLDEAGPPIQSGSFPSRRRQLPTPDLALSTISPWRGLLGHRADFANPRGCPVLSCLLFALPRLV